MLGALLAALLFQQAAAEPPPAALAPYVHDGRFDPGDYGWMRGRFDDASPSDKAQFATIGAWLDRCHARGLTQTQAELAALGVAEARLERTDFRDGLCAAVANMPSGIDTKSFDAFRRATKAAKPVAESYLLAVRIAEQVGASHSPDLGERLRRRPLGEQMLRTAMTWGEGELADAPALAPEVKAIVMARIGAAVAVRDRANTAWLKDIVDKQGWPRISQVGESATREAWLLVQHADADPAFQLKVLRLMEPLAASGEVSRANYAYLYDRVMLKIAGKQRYATQVTCRDGKRVPQPLEDEGRADALRKEAGLDPLAEYIEMMNRDFGPCPQSAPG